MKTLQQCKDEIAKLKIAARIDRPNWYDWYDWSTYGFPTGKELQKANDEVAELYASQFKREWIPVTDRLPEEGSIVELCYKVGDKYYHCLGLNVGYHKIEVGEDDDTLIDDSWYDDGFLTPGLYELIDCSTIRCDYDSYYIKRNAVYWKYLTPLPEPPKI